MVAGHLQEKNGIYYVVLTYKTYDGKRKTKWQSTGLPIKGNKRRAEAMMRELQDDFEPPVDPNGPPSKAMLFADYLVQWLEIAKSTVKLTTYASYKELSNSRIIPYFRNLGVTLGDLKAVHIQALLSGAVGACEAQYGHSLSCGYPPRLEIRSENGPDRCEPCRQGRPPEEKRIYRELLQQGRNERAVRRCAWQ